MQILKVSINDIKIPEYRQRKDMDAEALGELIRSIETIGLLQPIVIREGNILVAGERRFRSICTLAGLAGTYRFGGDDWSSEYVPCVSLGSLDPLAAESAELEENIRRVDLTWQERANATARLASLRRRQNPTIEISDISVEVGRTPDGSGAETTRREIILSSHMDKPEIAKAKTVDEAWKALKRGEEAQKRLELGQKVSLTFGAHLHQAINADCLEWMQAAPADQFDVICTDPPYGINAQNFGDAGGRLKDQTHVYDDSPEAWRKLMDVCANLWFKVAKPQAHLYVCCDIDNFVTLKHILTFAGWRVHRTPLVNYKGDGSRVPWPEHGPQRKWELVLYAIKGDKRVTRIYSDVIQTQGDDNLGHGAQKPVGLYIDLLKRSISPGDTVLDPFGGTGTLLAAAHELKCKATVIEADPTYHGIAVQRLQGLK